MLDCTFCSRNGNIWVIIRGKLSRVCHADRVRTLGSGFGASCHIKPWLESTNSDLRPPNKSCTAYQARFNIFWLSSRCLEDVLQWTSTGHPMDIPLDIHYKSRTDMHWTAHRPLTDIQWMSGRHTWLTSSRRPLDIFCVYFGLWTCCTVRRHPVDVQWTSNGCPILDIHAVDVLWMSSRRPIDIQWRSISGCPVDVQ